MPRVAFSSLKAQENYQVLRVEHSYSNLDFSDYSGEITPINYTFLLGWKKPVLFCQHT